MEVYSLVQLARVDVRVLVDVVCVMLVLIARVVVHAVIRTVSAFDQCQVHRRGDASGEGYHQESCFCHHDEEELYH